ncbi:MAG: SDR family oxidoreductase [Bifidobacteriaceae bacterium]|jgi:all-trans-retinol dehydrogenase (NAD+)|nr:SDR family oxidoreductase [Bifidobacteriaceae bacterium]
MKSYRQQGLALDGARVVITGAGSGIGRRMALGASRKGSAVAIWDLDLARAESVRDEILAEDGRASAFAVDVSDRNAVMATAEATGPVDIIINNAGVVSGRALLDDPPASIDRTLDVNLRSLFWVTQAFLGGMVERRTGYVVTIASAAGLVAGSKMADYAASKAGAIAFNESRRNELRDSGSGVATMVVCPFYIDTGMFAGVKSRYPALLPILEPRRVAGAVLRGIERGTKQLIMPPLVRTVPLLRLLPVGAFDFVADQLGINESMEDFAGRQGDRL